MTIYTPETHDTRATFEDVAEALAVIREQDDENHWMAGDVAAAWVANIEHGQRVAEIGKLADGSGYTYAGLRERIDCSVYWPVESRKKFNWLAWSYFNRARRGVGLDEAEKRLRYAVDNSMAVEEFSAWCSGGKPSNKTQPTFRDALLVVSEAVTELSGCKDVPELAQPFLQKLVKVVGDLLGALEKAKGK